MASFRDAMLPILDHCRGIGDTFGLRRFTITSVVRSWSGARPGIGASVDQPSTIKLSLGTAKVRVRQVSQREIVASGGFYQDQDLKIGPITPPYPGSSADNSAVSIFDPPADGSPTEIFFKIESPEFPAGGLWYKKYSQTVTRPLHFEFVVRNTGEQP